MKRIATLIALMFALVAPSAQASVMLGELVEAVDDTTLQAYIRVEMHPDEEVYGALEHRVWYRHITDAGYTLADITRADTTRIAVDQVGTYYVKVQDRITGASVSRVKRLGEIDPIPINIVYPIDGNLITYGTVAASKLAFVSGGVDTTNIIATINASSEGLDILGNRITIGATTAYESGYDPTAKVPQDSVVAYINISPDSVKIAGDQITIDGSTEFASGYDPTDKLEILSAGALAYKDIADWDTDVTDKPEFGGLAWLDAVSEALLDTTIIEGGFIKTSLVSADEVWSEMVRAGIVVADSIGAGTLTGSTVQTSDAGRRLVLDVGTHSLSGYNDAENRTVYLNHSFGAADENAAFTLGYGDYPTAYLAGGQFRLDQHSTYDTSKAIEIMRHTPTGDANSFYVTVGGDIELDGSIDGVDLNGGETSQFLRGDGTWQIPPSGITDHGGLTGLGDDDHTQYLTSTRHAAIGGNPHGLTYSDVGASSSSHVHQFSDIGNVNVISAADGQIIRYDEFNSLWVADDYPDYSDVGAAAASHNQSWSTITSTPTTLSGYGITDAAASSHSHSFASITSKPTTLSGYGITDAASDTELNAHKNDNGIGAHLPSTQGTSGQYVNYMGQFATVQIGEVNGVPSTRFSGTRSWVDPSSGDTHTVSVSNGIIESWTVQ